MPDSVTVSIGELTTGMLSLSFFVRFVLRSTCTHPTLSRNGTCPRIAKYQPEAEEEHLVSPKIYESWVQNHVVICIGDALAEQLSCCETCRKSHPELQCLQFNTPQPLWSSGDRRVI